MEQLGINYQQAQALVEKYIADPITKMHLRETEVFMRDLAKHFNENEEDWGIIGLLHDIDWDLTKNTPSEHCIKAQAILREAGASDFLIEAIISHGYGHAIIPELEPKQRTKNIEYCLAAAETLTGIIIASALIQPDKKLSNVNVRSLKKKFKNKSFAAKCNREIVMECEKAGIPLDEFLKIGLTAIQEIDGELGL